MTSNLFYVVPALLLSLLGLAACSPLKAVNVFTPSSGYTLSKDLSYGELKAQQLDVYVPKKAGEARPVVVFFYGGRWSSGAKDDYVFMAQALSSKGFVVVLPDYRHYPQVKFPAFVEDAARAVVWARRNIETYGGDPQQLFVMGHSAGAHIAAMLALDPQFLQAAGGSRDWLTGMIGAAGPYDFLPLEDDDIKDMFGPPERYAASQPINFADGSGPPLLLLHGRDDTTVLPKNTVNLAARENARGGRAQTIFYDGLGHITLLGAFADVLPINAPVLEDVAAFIDAETKAVEK